MAKAHTPEQPAARTPKIETLRAGGRSLRVAVWRADTQAGKTPARPLLFFNGIGANIELMSPLADWFADRDVITFDMPGVGGSPSPRLPYRPWTMALRTARLLDKLGYDGKVDVMGVSWGGGMAQQFALQHPKRVGKLILAATAAGMVMVPGDPKVLAKMANPRRYVDPAYMMANFQALYGESHTSSEHFYQLAAMAGWTSAPFLPFLKARTLVLMGEHDRIVPLINGKFLARLIPHARFESVPGGHLFLVSQPEKSVALMRSFLDESDEDVAEVRAAA